MSAMIVEKVQKNLYLIRLDKELGKMEAAQCVLQIRIGKQLFQINCEQDALSLIPAFSKEHRIREEKLLLASISEEALEIIAEDPFFTLVAGDKGCPINKYFDHINLFSPSLLGESKP